ncbi:unnamed protein product [Linum tenue]|uniref:Saccharopine dehydrogenase NADP binding domain-containing protein n=1 Tax=Linum tenue TaxID=586396 RepID=A0AAV0HPV3_9ROSI|nr:unnamed protein product [Linum tenue]
MEDYNTHQSPPPPYDLIILGASGFTGKLLLNCVGPFRLYGDPVVAACSQTGCDYLDICGEPEFMERMEVNYHDQAVEKGSLIVSACGFD